MFSRRTMEAWIPFAYNFMTRNYFLIWKNFQPMMGNVFLYSLVYSPRDPLEPSFRNNWKIIEFSLWILYILACSLIFSYLSFFRTPMWMLFNPNLFIFNNYFSVLTINDISMGYCMVENNLIYILYKAGRLLATPLASGFGNLMF